MASGNASNNVVVPQGIYGGSLQQQPQQPNPPQQSQPYHRLSYDQFDYIMPIGHAPQTPIHIDSNQKLLATKAPRKAPRPSQACGQCRTAKAKYDDPKPCSAWPVLPATSNHLNQSNKFQQATLEHLAKISDQMHEIDSRISKIERPFAQGRLKIKADTEGCGREEINHDELRKEQEEDLEGSPFAIVDGPQSNKAPELLLQDDDEESDNNLVFPASEASIPKNHTTSSTRILGWDSVWKHLRDFVTKNNNIKSYQYKMAREFRRGTLLPYGRGEVFENQSVLEQEPMPHLDTEIMDDDEASEASASPVTHFLRDRSRTFAQQATMHVTESNPDNRREGLDSTSSNLELDSKTIKRLANSYMKHINCMHPIVYPALLNELIKKFPRSIPESTSKPEEHTLRFEASGTIGSKRKREGDYVMLPTYRLDPSRLQRSIDNALLLIILALGKICEHKSRVPPPVSDIDTKMRVGESAASQMLPSDFSPATSPQSSLPSAKHGDENRDHRTRQNLIRSNLQKDVRQPMLVHLRNLDTSPGLAYWALASKIIGNTMGGTSLSHVQVYILASLYFGQLARVQESYTYLTLAGRAMQTVLLGHSERYKQLAKENKMGEGEDAQILLSFWSCLQLESDILVELDLPQSRLSKWEHDMPWPDGASIRKQGIPSYIVNSYMSQLFTRKHMNIIHQGLHNASSEKDYKLPVDNIVKKELLSRIKNSEAMLSYVSAVIQKSLNGHEPPDQYIANFLWERIQAKKYSALIITYRPCLMMVMNRPKEIPFNLIPNEIRHYALLCLTAMERSTAAFPMKDDERDMISNPWGAAHAQWGNAIVLQAAYLDPDLQKHVDREKLVRLVTRTLRHLRSFAQSPSSLVQEI